MNAKCLYICRGFLLLFLYSLLSFELYILFLICFMYRHEKKKLKIGWIVFFVLLAIGLWLFVRGLF